MIFHEQTKNNKRAIIQAWNGTGLRMFLEISWMWSLVHFIISSSIKCLGVALRLCLDYSLFSLNFINMSS